MPNSINYYLSLISPWSYLGHERLLHMAKKNGVTVNPLPVDFSVIFADTGGLPLAKRSAERKAYRLQELQRWKDYLDIPLTLEPKHFPVSDKLAAAMVVKLRTNNVTDALKFAGACLRACWKEDRDISNRHTLIEIAQENNFNGESLLDNTDASLQVIADDSANAVKLGVFGAPSYLFEEQLFWGQDRLSFLQRTLEAHAKKTRLMQTKKSV